MQQSVGTSSDALLPLARNVALDKLSFSVLYYIMVSVV